MGPGLRGVEPEAEDNALRLQLVEGVFQKAVELSSHPSLRQKTSRLSNSKSNGTAGLTQELVEGVSSLAAMPLPYSYFARDVT